MLYFHMKMLLASTWNNSLAWLTRVSNFEGGMFLEFSVKQMTKARIKFLKL